MLNKNSGPPACPGVNRTSMVPLVPEPAAPPNLIRPRLKTILAALVQKSWNQRLSVLSGSTHKIVAP